MRIFHCQSLFLFDDSRKCSYLFYELFTGFFEVHSGHFYTFEKRIPHIFSLFPNSIHLVPNPPELLIDLLLVLPLRLLFLETRPLNLNIFCPHGIHFPLLGIQLPLLFEDSIPMLGHELLLIILLVLALPLKLILLCLDLLKLCLQLLNKAGLVILPEPELTILLLEHGILEYQITLLLLQQLNFIMQDGLPDLLLLDLAAELDTPGLLII